MALPTIRNATRGLHWDTVQKGLVLQVQPTGQRSYKCIYSFRGKPRWYTIADVKAIGSRGSEKIGEPRHVSVAQSDDPQGDRRAQRQQATFTVIANRYVDEYARNTTSRSWKQASSLVAKHVCRDWVT